MRREWFVKLLVGMCEFVINNFDLQYLFYVPSISKTKQHAPATVPPLDLVASDHLYLLQDQEHKMLPGEGVQAPPCLEPNSRLWFPQLPAILQLLSVCPQQIIIFGIVSVPC